MNNNSSDIEELSERVTDALMYLERLKENVVNLETELNAVKETWEEIRG